MIATRRIRPASRPPVPLIRLARGDVAQRGDHVGIVVDVAGARLLVWPVRWRLAERAGDIGITGWLDLAALGSPRQAMVQTSVLMEVPLAGQRRLGTISDKLLLEVERASDRQAENRGVIARWRGEREHRRDECAPPATVL